MMIAAALSVFFGGTGMDGMAAALSGAVLYGMLHGSSILKLNTIIQNMLCSAVTAMAVLLLVRMGIGTQPDKIMIGDIMLLIPGLMSTNAIRDVLIGDTLSGIIRLIAALLLAAALALGFMGAIILFGRFGL